MAFSFSAPPTELLKRMAIAVPMVAIVAGLWWYLDVRGILVLLALAGAGLTVELTKLANPQQTTLRGIGMAVVGLVVALVAYIGGGVGWMVLAIMIVHMRLPLLALELGTPPDEKMYRQIQTMLVLLMVTIAIHGLVSILTERGAVAVIFAIACAQLGDTAGYFSGKTIGGKRAFPTLSPNKTRVGCIAHWLVNVFLVAVFAPLLFGDHQPQAASTVLDSVLAGETLESLVTVLGVLGIIVAGTVLSFAAQAGDIWVSALKRRAQVKDSGKLLPGHGGLADRADSILGVACVISPVAYGLDWLGTLVV